MLENRRTEIRKLTVKVRVDSLKLMHQFVIGLDVSDVYALWTTYCVPDEATDEMLNTIASNDADYYEIKSYFIHSATDWL